ncbi:alanyl-tRNA editing protein [Cytobacillus solani]|uniref:Alanyl tRNA synthetase n=1 Tax=Cytobacillus solani TaxID=1637975 RepID=A0A0Q3TDK1_9BACI|nr:alanyl-tRNA editing protein [Cytobacillus solani]KOP79898.1 alanyl tRNA synthetase [Bacillus sp. FJAT-21945]KQL21221.1 alanyl tRNA synthetase [Cytobacillus solani]
MNTRELYLDDSYLTSCTANVVKLEGEKVSLDRTVFYPTGGGQEYDTGLLIQGGQTFEVYQVKNEKGEIIHYVKNADQLKYGEIKAEIDWERRQGLMKHHSLLHILGAVVYKKYNALCTGNKIYPDRARIDFNNLHDLSDEEYQEIVNETNKIIKENHPVAIRYVSRMEAENIPGLIKTAINLLPASVTRIRLISIDSIDEQACGGTHVSNTGEIGEMALLKVSSKGKNNKRLEVALVTPG